MPPKKSFKVAFNPITGSHMTTAEDIYEDGERIPPTLLDKFEFESSVVFVRYVNTNHNPHFIFKDNEEREFTMFISDFAKAIPYMVGGRLTGTFGFVKRGVSTGVTFRAPDF